MKNKPIADFQAVFFIGNRAVARMLSEVVKKSDDRLYTSMIGLPENFDIPFFLEEGRESVVYTIEQNTGAAYQAEINKEPCFHHEISNGDFITFRSESNSSVKVLFIRTSSINPGYKKYRLQKNTNYYIGRTPDNDISCSLTDYISREKHAAIHIDEQGNASIEDLKRTAGIYINGTAAHSRKLEIFDEIFLMGLSIVFMGDCIAVSQNETQCSLLPYDGFETKQILSPEKDDDYFVSTPRIFKSIEQEEIQVDAPPAPPRMDRTPALLQFGPSMTMGVVMIASLSMSIFNAIRGGHTASVVAGVVMAGGMLMSCLMWPYLLKSHQKKMLAEDERHRRNKYASYISDIEQKLIAKADNTSHVLNDSLHPAPEVLYSFLDSDVSRLRLWERSAGDEDFLEVRMGKGSRPFDAVSLKTPRMGFQLYDDELRHWPEELIGKYSTIADVPLTLDLEDNRTIGVIGEQKYIRTVLDEIILNIISLHSYDEVKLVLIVDPASQKHFEVFKNVPHIWSDDKKVRYFASGTDEVHFVFNVIDEELKFRESEENQRKMPVPHYCIIVTDPALIEREALVRYMEDADNTVGLTTIFAYGDITRIPKSCGTLIQSDDQRTGFYIKNKNANRFIPFRLDPIDEKGMQRFAQELSRLLIKRNQKSMGIADRISFLQMYRAGNVSELGIEKHWDSNNSAKSLAAPVGVMAGGEVFSLDLHEAYHGCHGLVAGTTGSGKSEFLQAFVLSLAVNYSPKEVAFVLVDFKGGDMARPFMEKQHSPALPHLSATISNLSGNVLYRALVSLEAEIKYRQRLFNEAAAGLGIDKLDINSYHKYYKGGRLSTPLPHLVIIIDEFAQLEKQQPEFLAKLIDVAQVGRSLGIHLILATQKPGGIVDPQIMSNSRFRVCLKVADKMDSIEMLSRPDAAMIRNPGRMYLQVGYNEIYECIQSGYSGADYIPVDKYISDEEITVQMTDNTASPIHSARMDFASSRSGRTQLEAVVAELAALGQKKNLKARPLWLEMLPDQVMLNSLKQTERGLCTATIGLADFVKTQEQKPLYIDFIKNGHTALYGASGTGKTTLLQTLVYSMVCGYGYSPEELNFYAIDFGGRNLGYLSRLPHTGGVAFSGEDQKLSEMIYLLHDLIEERKALFAAHGCGTFSDYRAVSGAPLPAVLVLIDNYSSFREKYIGLSEALTEVISAGRAFGVFFVITGNTRNSIYYKVTEHISSYFTLKMNDFNNYMDILGVRTPIIPEDVSGRGITVIDREVVEFQTAVAFSAKSEAERISEIGRKYDEIRADWVGFRPALIGEGQDPDGSSKQTVSSRYGRIESSGAGSYASQHTERPGMNTYGPENEALEPVPDDSDHLVLAKSVSGAASFGIDLSEDYTVCICAKDQESLAQSHQSVLGSISQYSDRDIVFIDDDQRFYESTVEKHSGCRYLSGVTEIDAFIESLRPELNARLNDEEARQRKRIVVISEFNAFFDMITDEQAGFMRKVFKYINSPKYGILFICGFNVLGGKNNDRLFMSLVVNAKNYLIGPDSYEAAVSKIETLPAVYNVKPSKSYFCSGDKVSEIRW